MCWEETVSGTCPLGTSDTEKTCARVDQLLVLGMGNLQPLIRNPFNGYIDPYYWVDEFIPCYMEIIGV